MSALQSTVLTKFDLPEGREAWAPAEERGLERDQVNLLVASEDSIEHVLFRDIETMLHPGDLLVVNTSATLAAEVDGIRLDGRPAIVHFSSPVDDETWIVELRAEDGPLPDAHVGEIVYLPSGAHLQVLNAHPDEGRRHSRLWSARIAVGGVVERFLERFGRPISYKYNDGRWPLDAYQTIFAKDPGSAEMASAARPFTDRLVTRLITRGINLAPITLHCGVSSLEAGESPQDERYRVPEETAWLVNETRARGGRVIAVGTTATRALETVARQDGSVFAHEGITHRVISIEHPAQVVDGLITGWHAPRASHLSLLEGVAGPALVQRAYDAALENGYLWHEFGDSCLLLPNRKARLRSITGDPN
jgi:S-adenosylmethionine:tRNA ribosyltransferase-isomerase